MVPGAEENIYNSLKWAGLNWDEGPQVGGPHGPYRQSERAEIYAQHAGTLIKSGHAYRCFCPKHRLDRLRESAQKLHPPSMASYDRKCVNLTPEEVETKIRDGEEFVVRFKAPTSYPEFYDLLHGKLNLQTQVNHLDVRHDDPVLVKSDGLPTYHLANVVDDHLMRITHVIRGEEWLPSTPKHIAMYTAFGWTPPKFVHIPLLTSASDKKLSKRSGDVGVLSLAEKGILPEAMINFVALFGWSPHRELRAGQHASEIFSLTDLESMFSLEGLTKGNAKVTDKKLLFLNKHYFLARLEDPAHFDAIATQIYAAVQPLLSQPSDIPEHRKTTQYTTDILQVIKHSVASIEDFISRAQFLYVKPDLNSAAASGYLSKVKQSNSLIEITAVLRSALENVPPGLLQDMDKAHEFCNKVVEANAASLAKPKVFQGLRYALTGSVPGIDIPTIFSLLGSEVVEARLTAGLKMLDGQA